MKIGKCPSCQKENVALHPGTYTIKAHQEVVFDRMGYTRKTDKECTASGADGLPFELGRIQRDILYWNERIKEKNEEIQRVTRALSELEKKKTEAIEKEAVIKKAMEIRSRKKE